MKNNPFWNDALKYGAILGAIMSLSMMFETYILHYSDVPLVKALTIYVVEWFAVVIVYIWLLVRFTKRYSQNFAPEEGFTFGQGFGFIIVLAFLVAVIVGMMNTIFISIAGFDGFIEGYIGRINEMMLYMGENNLITQSLNEDVEVLVDTVAHSTQPSMFESILAAINGYVFSAMLVGAIIALAIRRKPQMINRD